ncbi:stage V sporulation protein B [Paenibacillus turicensis]|uniref:Stage V sporulation protein B n=2 Tax=Paenibacillus turicensis TaxID=160487 RepID=A0ABS4FN23_9BACL|nr:stage V sporulation protein B [Paenibacillus turicensis]
MHKSSLIRQTGIRLSAIGLSKMMGLIGRISLTRMIGAEGIGLFQIAYAYFGFALMIITGGFPTALAMYTARNKQQGWIWFKRLSILLMTCGAIAFFVTLTFSEQIPHLLGNANSYYFIRALAPALVVVPSLALLRGYLQGLEQYSAIALSEVTEQLIRVTVMLTICYLLLQQGTFYAGGFSLVGTTLGAISAFAILFFFYIEGIEPSSYKATASYSPAKGEGAWFVRSSLAICLTRLLIPFSDMTDALIIPLRLQSAGYSPSQATALFGMLTGMALLIAYMPTLVTAAISHTMTMKLAAAWKEKQNQVFRSYSLKAIRYAWFWGIISSLFLWIYAEELAFLIFNSTEAGAAIKALSLIPLIVGIREITTSILWAQEQKKVTFIATVIGIICAVCCHYFLIPILYIPLYGAIIGILLMEIIILIANVFALRLSLNNLQISKILGSSIVLLLTGIPLGYVFRLNSSLLLPNPLGLVIGMLLYGSILLVVGKWVIKWI